MKTFVAQHKRRGLAVLVSDLYDPAGFERGINVLRYNKFDPFVVHVVDPAEARPKPRAATSLVYDCETGDEREVTVTAKVLERFARLTGGTSRRSSASARASSAVHRRRRRASPSTS